ncbi:MAG: NUDIX hydrolase [Actinomycetes bacterium]
MTGKVIVAAGTVTLRSRVEKPTQVLLVHRPAYDDWTLPKGKLDPDEYEAVAAARETWEETGVNVVLRQPVDLVRYPVGGATKVVHYWLAEPVESRPHKPNKEVDKVAWLTPKGALERMTYDDEKALLSRALQLPGATPFLIIRHSKAMSRENWSGRDQARPITARGRKQSKRLIPLLAAFGVQHLASSTSTRCMQTLLPYARRNDLDLAGWALLSEEIGEHDPVGVTRLMKRMAKEAASSGVPTAVCGHRPVLPTMLEALGVPVRPLPTAACVIAHLDPQGAPLAVEYHRPRA